MWLILLFLLSVNLFSEELDGTTEPYESATLSFSISGTIDNINVKEGSIVKRHNALITLEHKEELLKLERAKIIMNDTSELNLAKVTYEIAIQEYNSTKSVYDQTQSISEEDLRKKRLERDIAKAELERVKVAELKEVVEYKIEKEYLAKHSLRAPFSGVVVKIDKQVGENCETQEPVIHLVNVEKCRFITYVDNQYSSVNLHKNDTVTVYFNDRKIVKKGIVEFVSPVVDQASGLYKVKLVIPNKDLQLKPGLTGTMILN